MSHINQANPNPGIQVGSARLHLSGDGCNHRDSNVCPACEIEKIGSAVMVPEGFKI